MIKSVLKKIKKNQRKMEFMIKNCTLIRQKGKKHMLNWQVNNL